MRTPNASSSSVRVFWPPYSREELIELLRARMPALAAELPLRRVTLFGSWAKGRATAFSDIDLMVIHKDPARADAYRRVLDAVQLRGLEPHIYCESDAAKVKGTLDRMLMGGVELFPPDPEPSPD